jgi:transposase
MNIAVDSTGFGTKSYHRWFNIRNTQNNVKKAFLKLHATVDTVKKAVLSATVTRGHAHDSPQLKKLLRPIKDIGDATADSGYLSRRNCELIAKKHGTPYIMPKKNTTARAYTSKVWREMILKFKHYPVEWLKHYHKRSISESVFSTIKRKLGAYLTSVKLSLQKKELFIKVIVYDLMLLV